MPGITMLQIQTLVSQPFEENTYILWQPPAREAVVIDPGLEPEMILDFLRENDLIPAVILNTHGHADHIAGNAALKSAFPHAPLVIGAGDAPMLLDADLNLSAPFGMPVTSPPADRLVREGDIVEAAALVFRVLDIPGHSPGHVVYVYDGPPIQIFGGDVLFRGSVGRTDFPGGSSEVLFEGIRNKLFVLPANGVVYPGHGPVTTIGQEKATNPFVGDE
jgi:glyoxylase-like metal-dependent hydrolase (beta-lactamase superfamily II)